MAMEHATDPEQGKLRKSPSDGTQAAIWVWSLLALVTLLALGIAWGLSHRLSIQAPGLNPELPMLPEKRELPSSPDRRELPMPPARPETP
jgi:hypothetical protein